ncbi:TPA: 50S ribosomal protein L11 [Candidatus Micrarchaeota archaeon]|nr:50S ribosomal protein L11 [Candidatus Micrarchaeota archaeon]
MSKQTIATMVEGGKASAAPPLGPALGPSGLNIGEVIAKINERTKEFAGMQVPIKIVFEKGSKDCDIEIGTPPASALIKKELGLKEPVKEEAGVKGKRPIGSITVAQVVKIAGMKKDATLAKSLKQQVKEIAGTCLSLGVTIEGNSPKDFVKEVNDGKHDSQLKG